MDLFTSPQRCKIYLVTKSGACQDCSAFRAGRAKVTPKKTVTSAPGAKVKEGYVRNQP